MFTGIIQDLGDVLEVTTTGKEARFRIKPQRPFADTTIGESIAVNGVCLTAETFDGGAFRAYASGETLSRTTLGSLRQGQTVNLERALALGDRLGGHLVSGHVDCVARVARAAPLGQATCFRLSFPREAARQMVLKGSVALDGISLTISALGADFLEVTVIPETMASTTMQAWKPGRTVNLETDMIAKYVERLLSSRGALYSGEPSAQTGAVFDEDFLRRNGF